MMHCFKFWANGQLIGEKKEGEGGGKLLENFTIKETMMCIKYMYACLPVTFYLGLFNFGIGIVR